MSERVRIINADGTVIADVIVATYAMAHRFVDDQTLHDGDQVEIYDSKYIMPLSYHH